LLVLCFAFIDSLSFYCRSRDIFDDYLIDYSNRSFASTKGKAEEVQLDTLTAPVPSVSNGDTAGDSRGADCHNDLLTAFAANTNVGDTAVACKSSDKMTNELCSSLLVKGRHSRHSEKARSSQKPQTKAQDADIKSSRNSIFVLLGLTD